MPPAPRPDPARPDPESPAAALTLEPVSYDDPAVQALTADVQAYYRSIYGGTDDSPMAAAEFAPPTGLFLLGRWTGEPVAMGGWRLEDGIDALGGARVAELRRMFTVPAVRRLGVGRRLLRALEQTAADAGADVLVLSTGAPQRDALDFYRSCGYVDVPAFGFYRAMPDVACLGKRLPAPAPAQPVP